MTRKSRNRKVAVGIVLCLACVLAGGLLFASIEKKDKSEQTAETAPSSSSREDTDQNTDAATDTEVTDTGYVVYIETGHGREDSGRWDPGCSWSDGENEYDEASMMLPITKAMVSYVRKSGIKVYTDADTDNEMNLEETLDFLDAHREVDAFVNVHCDWSEAASGTMPLYRTDEQLALGKALNAGVHSYVDIPDRGPTYREDLDTLTSEKVHCPSILFETGSINADNETLTEHSEEYGKGLAKGLCDYFGVEFKD